MHRSPFCFFITPRAAGAWQKQTGKLKGSQGTSLPLDQRRAWNDHGAWEHDRTPRPSHQGQQGRRRTSLPAGPGLLVTSYAAPLPALLPAPTRSWVPFSLKLEKEGNGRLPGLGSGSTLSKLFTLSERQHPDLYNRLAEMKQQHQAPHRARAKVYPIDGGHNYKELMPWPQATSVFRRKLHKTCKKGDTALEQA